MKNIFLILVFLTVVAQAQEYPRILPLEERAAVIDEIIEEKVTTVLPSLMDRTGIDMWVVIAREYNEDPVIETLLPSTWLAARRRTILVMYKPEGADKVETLAVARYNVGSLFASAWDKEKQPDQWKRLVELIEERDPQVIGINKSLYFGLADGLATTDYEEFMAALPKKYQGRIKSAEKLAIGWLETRTEREKAIYPHIMRIAHEIIAEAFSDNVIHPGITSTDDVVWWMREKVLELKLETWFHPTVDVQRASPESQEHLRSFANRPETDIIMPGDLVHCDFGITYLRLNTDTQQLAYVLKPGETDAPEYLKEALAVGNRLQDIFLKNFEQGKTGNEILKKTREEAIAEGIRPSIYSHPIGYHGHGAGPAIGMWDAQEGVPVTGDYPLYYNTAYSIELNATTYIEEWNKDVRIMLEQEAMFDEDGIDYIDYRQTELLLIPGK